MNRIQHLLARLLTRLRSAGRATVQRHLAALLLGIGALGALPVRAELVNFEDVQAGIVGHNDYFRSGNYWFTGWSAERDATNGDFVGMVVDGRDRDTCVNGACPVNNASHYYAGVNDGVLFMDPLRSSDTFQLKSFDASYIGAYAGATYPSIPALLRVQGFFADGSYLYQDFALGGATGGHFNFQSYSTGAFGNAYFSEIAFFALACNAGGSCSPFTTNEGQFAIDNILTAAAVPEPSTYLMMAFGLMALCTMSRRRDAA